MNRRILVLTTDGDSREDGNVYYAGHWLVEHPTKTFSEAIFSSVASNPGLSQEKCLEQIKELGYDIIDLDVVIITHGYDDEDA